MTITLSENIQNGRMFALVGDQALYVVVDKIERTVDLIVSSFDAMRVGKNEYYCRLEKRKRFVSIGDIEVIKIAAQKAIDDPNWIGLETNAINYIRRDYVRMIETAFIQH